MIGVDLAMPHQLINKEEYAQQGISFYGHGAREISNPSPIFNRNQFDLLENY